MSIHLEVPHDGLHGRLVAVVHEHDGAVQGDDGVAGAGPRDRGSGPRTEAPEDLRRDVGVPAPVDPERLVLHRHVRQHLHQACQRCQTISGLH